MGQKLSDQDLALYRAVDEVLHYVWDPIGVGRCPQAREEYRGYLPQVFGMLRDGVEEAAIAAYLTSVTEKQMGLTARPDCDREVARILLDWKQSCRGDEV